MIKKKPSQSLYIIFGVVIAVLLALIGYFAYLLIAPSNPSTTTSNSNATANVNTTTNTNQTKKSKNSNSNKNSNTNVNSNSAEGGLVEPVNSNSNTNSNANSNTNVNSNVNSDTNTNAVVAGEGEEVITLYFAKATSDCGEVFPVERAVTPSDDFYGQIILADMAGPTADEAGYVTAADSIRLRRVEYTSAGPTIYVDEAYDALSTCDQQTAKAQLVETANAMFDLPEGGAGEVIVGHPDDTTDTTNTNTNDNSNTNS